MGKFSLLTRPFSNEAALPAPLLNNSLKMRVHPPLSLRWTVEEEEEWRELEVKISGWPDPKYAIHDLSLNLSKKESNHRTL